MPDPLRSIARRAASEAFGYTHTVEAGLIPKVADAVTVAVLQYVRHTIDAENVPESEFDEGRIQALEAIDDLLSALSVRPERELEEEQKTP